MKSLGARGEEAVARFLEKEGFRIVDRDVDYGRWGQIDLVACRDEILCFFEVKTRSHARAYGGAKHAVSAHQLMNLKRCMALYCSRAKWVGGTRLLLATVVPEGDALNLEGIYHL